jgi:hypothetical protein
LRRARSVHVVTTTVTTAKPAAAAAPAADPLERLLDKVEAPGAASALAQEPARQAPALRTARILSLAGRTAQISWRGQTEVVEAELAPEVERDLVLSAIEEKATVLVETGAPNLVVGLVQTRSPRELKLKAGTVTLEGEQEVLIRSGRAALRLREDGDIEIVGSRISASSRGLFRLVGRILRLN